MTRQEIKDYITQTPHNTNPAVLMSMIDALNESSGKEESGTDLNELLTEHLTVRNTGDESVEVVYTTVQNDKVVTVKKNIASSDDTTTIDTFPSSLMSISTGGTYYNVPTLEVTAVKFLYYTKPTAFTWLGGGASMTQVITFIKAGNGQTPGDSITVKCSKPVTEQEAE